MCTHAFLRSDTGEKNKLFIGFLHKKLRLDDCQGAWGGSSSPAEMLPRVGPPLR